jgi:hypothetical protein
MTSGMMSQYKQHILLSWPSCFWATWLCDRAEHSGEHSAVFQDPVTEKSWMDTLKDEGAPWDLGENYLALSFNYHGVQFFSCHLDQTSFVSSPWRWVDHVFPTMWDTDSGNTHGFYIPAKFWKLSKTLSPMLSFLNYLFREFTLEYIINTGSLYKLRQIRLK